MSFISAGSTLQFTFTEVEVSIFDLGDAYGKVPHASIADLFSSMVGTLLASVLVHSWMMMDQLFEGTFPFSVGTLMLEVELVEPVFSVKNLSRL